MQPMERDICAYSAIEFVIEGTSGLQKNINPLVALDRFEVLHEVSHPRLSRGAVSRRPSPWLGVC